MPELGTGDPGGVLPLAAALPIPLTTAPGSPLEGRDHVGLPTTAVIVIAPLVQGATWLLSSPHPAGCEYASPGVHKKETSAPAFLVDGLGARGRRGG